MSQYLRQSTSATIMFGPFVDKSDGVTLLTNATTITDIDHASTGIFLSKNGAASAIRHASVTASVADSYGMMKVTLDTTDTNTIGTLDVLFAKAATYLPVHKSFTVLDEAVYDAMFGTTALATTTNITAGTITTATNVTTVNGLAAGVITAASIAADAITDAKVAADVTIASVTGAVGSVTGAVGSVTGAVGSVTGAVGSIAAGGITTASFAAGAIDAAAIAANAIGASELAADAATEIADAILTRQMTESYAANGVAPTLAQAQFAIHQMLMQFGISGTSLTVKKLDNSTTAFVVTLDSATAPTSAVRT